MVVGVAVRVRVRMVTPPWVFMWCLYWVYLSHKAQISLLLFTEPVLRMLIMLL